MSAQKRIRKTTIELTQDQYFFLKEKVIGLQKQNKNASLVSIIRDLIEKDREKCLSAVPMAQAGTKEKKSYGA